jgi:hypothetical protein
MLPGHDRVKGGGGVMSISGAPDRLSSVRVGNPTRSSEEGPFAGVVHLIETRDLNEAIQVAAKIAMARRIGLEGPSHTRSSSHEILVHDLP